MALSERTPSRGGSRFGKLSSNMFFIRNTAKPKRVRHIEGLNGALICNVNDDPAAIGSVSSSTLGFNPVNLPAFETPRRVERLVPPTGFWNTYGVIQDTDRWRKELASLASASGLGVADGDQKHSTKQMTAEQQQHNSRSGAHYSTRTGRFNEGTSKSRGRTSSKHATAQGDMLFNVPENERDMWMLQVLCQLLGTSNLEDVQSWLVSATQTEKEQARAMINSALKGLKESERAAPEQIQQSVDLNSLNTFVERQKNDEKKASQKYVQESLNRSLPVLQSIDEEQQTDIQPNDSWIHLGKETGPSTNNNTTYKRAFQNFNRRSITSFDTRSAAKNDDDRFYQGHENENDDEEQIDTIQLDDDHERPRSASFTQPKKSRESLPKPPSSHKQQRHRVESIQFNDDDNNNNNIDDHEDRPQPRKDITTPPAKIKLSSSVDDKDENGKSRQIRQLRNKLSRQEEESKKQLEELQSKQARLENAIKLLVKQTSSYQTRRQKTRHEDENADAPPVVNVIIQSPRVNNREDKQRESDSSSGNQRDSSHPTAAIDQKFKKTMNKNRTDNGVKIGDYTIQDVKVQIRLSRLDNRPGKIYSGIWKPDASTLHRLQAN